MFEICALNKCTGCMACTAICSHQAIVQSDDDFGFFIPHIIQDRCVDCGLCRKMCPANTEPTRYPSLDCYAAVANDDNLLKHTASGGIATLITRNFIEQGGVVYGCTGENIRNVRHIRITDVSEISRLQGSKYVQSNIMDVYHNVRSDLNNGLNVLFIGVSCQIAGIKNFLIKDHLNFYAVDLICHGAASQKSLNEDLDYYQKKYKFSRIDNVRFREKSISSNGRHCINYGLYFNADNTKYFFKGIRDPFILSYFNNQSFRDSCYDCAYTNLNRVSDITIGDFWGLSDDAGLEDKLGVSVCITHNKKGEFLLNLIKGEITLIPRDLKEAVKGNPQLIKPTAIPESLSRFRTLYLRKGFIKAVKTINRKQLLKSEMYTMLKCLRLLSVIHSLKKICRI